MVPENYIEVYQEEHQEHTTPAELNHRPPATEAPDVVVTGPTSGSTHQAPDLAHHYSQTHDGIQGGWSWLRNDVFFMVNQDVLNVVAMGN